jgi:hypothetical protein
MKIEKGGKENIILVSLTERDEEILRTIHFYRYMTALDVSQLLWTPSQVSRVRGILTRFLVAAQVWSKKQSDFTLAHTRTSYELAKTQATVEVDNGGSTQTVPVVPDAWLKFVRVKDNAEFPVLLEIDRGTEHKQRFKQQVRARIEFIKLGGLYSKIFGTEAVMVAYATTGQKSEYRETRRTAMGAWTQEVLGELQKEDWASLFRFHSLSLEDMYNTPLFEAPVWYRLGSPNPAPLLTP